MASSRWPFWPFGASASSSPTNFLLLSRTNIERICELIRHEDPLNPRQCLSLSSKLKETVENIESLASLSEDVNPFYGCVALENFYRVSEKAKKLVENCCSVDWCHWCPASAFQIQNEEAFREILLETSLSYSTICKLLEDINKGINLGDLRSSSTFDPPSAEEIFEDRVALRERLKGLVNAANISSSNFRSLGKYLLGRVNFALKQSIDEDFDVRSSNLSLDGEDLDGEWSEKSVRLGASVIKTTWLDVPCAKKEFEDTLQEDEWLAEAKILASLNHPNVVKFLCCNKYETVHTSGHFIAMEQMETSLGSFIRRLKERGAKLSLFLALDIILQIGYGMCYLHDSGIAHRDLKTPNVVCSINQQFLEVKVVDFGLAKIKLNENKSNTMTRPKIGTTTYMAPEAFSNGRANWFKADVYSFSVMCSVILSGEEPFQDLKRRDLCAAICSGQRPELPVDTPKELASLIKEGWVHDRDLRPNFFDICARLEKLRHRLLRMHSLHSLGLRLKVEDQYDEEYPDQYYEKYIENRMKKRSELRRSPELALNLTTEEEWFDGDEVEEQQQSVSSFSGANQCYPRPSLMPRNGLAMDYLDADYCSTSFGHSPEVRRLMPIALPDPVNRGDQRDRRLNVLVLGDSKLVDDFVHIICGAVRHAQFQGQIENCGLTESRNSLPPIYLYGDTDGINGDDLTNMKAFVKARNERWHRTKVEACWSNEVYRRSPRERPDRTLRLHMVWAVCRSISELPKGVKWSEITEKLYGLPVQILVIGTESTQNVLDSEYDKVLVHGRHYFPNAQSLEELREELIVKVAPTDGDLKENLWRKCWAAKTRAEIENVANLIREIR